jgi:hypothetical protein
MEESDLDSLIIAGMNLLFNSKGVKPVVDEMLAFIVNSTMGFSPPNSFGCGV